MMTWLIRDTLSSKHPADQNLKELGRALNVMDPGFAVMINVGSRRHQRITSQTM